MPIILCIFVLVLDQLAKLYIHSAMIPGMSHPVVHHIFHITYVLNPGAAFGILAHQRMFFIMVGSIIMVAAAYFYPQLQRENNWVRYGSAMLLGGAIGNLMDRVRTGYVIDFLDFRVWPVFNLADIGIVLGVACIIYAILFHKMHDGTKIG